MAEQQSRLAIVIDSTGAQRNAEGLAGALAKMTQAGQKAADSAGKTAKATDQEAKALSDLLDRIDPVNAALNRLDDQQRQLAKFQAKGFIDTDTFSEYSKKIEDARGRLTGFADTAGKAGISAKQAAYQMRMIPAQMTDIAVSLAGGQNPLMVLLQQGGQLKDMFGGIGPAIRGVGTYISGLVNPATVAAASMGALALAYYQGTEEQDEFNKSLILSGNTLGVTAGQLGQISQQVARVTNTSVGNAASVLNRVVASGKISRDTLQEVTATIINMSKATGQATDGMLSDFEKIAKDPVDAIAKLNEQYHFLSAETYNRIKALQDEGNTTDAARLATVAYSGELNRRTVEIRNNLSDLERAWDGIWSSASAAWDAMRDSGRTQSPENQLATLEASLADARQRQAEGGIWNRFTANANGYNISEMEQQIATLKSQITTQGVLNNAISDYQERQDKAIKTQQEADRSGQQYMNNAERRAKAIEKENSFLKAGAITAEEYARRVSRINDMYKDPKQPKGKAYTEDAGARMLDQLRQQQQVLMSQADTGEKIGTQQQALIKWEQQLSDIKSKQTLTADQKSLLASADLITSQLQQNAALERQIETREKLLALDKARADITRTITNRQSQYATDELFAGGGLSQNEQQQYTQRLSLEQSYNDKITQLRQNRASATSDIAREEIDQEIQLQQQALQTELSNYDNHIARMNQLRGSFTAGASRAWQEYQDSAANVSAMSEQLFTNAFGNMEDALVKFATTGKASFSDFANSVLSDIARIAIRQSLVGIGSSLSGSLGGLFGGAAASGAASAASSSNAFSSGAYSNLKLNAKGGVYDSPSLSAYSGDIYDSPKFFAFAKGAGVFGEAGPEAIMPLTRSSDGSLGVRMVGGGQAASVKSGDTIIHQTIQVSGNGDAALQRAMEEAARKGATDGAKRARQDMLQDFQTRGQGRRLLGV
ncbi:phage tail tape measure protein [Mixta mediterraneensis]|uniref:phage tail tape measure protein n=1 Tax=Mixta mediterraneensis TaxID=2758443 RepID=UPI00187396E1|nr:phage tail tape measure protein [Mixta mediterraneensis]MBE5251836.1 phage tail tape measure protein [Mixta mediterraneensis]